MSRYTIHSTENLWYVPKLRKWMKYEDIPEELTRTTWATRKTFKRACSCADQCNGAIESRIKFRKGKRLILDYERKQ